MKRWIAMLLALAMLPGVTACGKKNKTETFEAYYQEFTEEDVVYEDSELFVNSQLLLTVVSGTKTSTIEKLIKDAGGKIVGYIEISEDYQIEFPEGKTLDELDQLVDKWNEVDFVEFVSLHNVFYMDTSAVNYETDPWLPTNRDVSADEAEWYESIPGGTNWWAEMIRMPSVWSMDREFETVRVGVIDNMFNTEHEDLDDRIVKVYYNPEILSNYHGSHVTGIIAAENNNIGITGVSQNAEIYGYAMHGKTTPYQSATSVFQYYYAISKLLSDGVKVINISMGGYELVASAQLDANAGLDEYQSTALRDSYLFNAQLESFLSKCLAYHDFLIIKAAGNCCNVNWTKNENPTPEHPYSYINPENNQTTGARTYEIRAYYDIFAGIDDPVVRSHILVVGSADLCYGDDLVPVASESIFSNAVPDLYAPGGTYTSDSLTIEILSTTEGTVGTEEKGGTSMAAPVVTGIAALVWGVNPGLTANQVQTIIRNSAAFNTRFPGVVDALAAIQMAEKVSAMPEEDRNDTEFGTIMGYAIENIEDAQTDETTMEVLQDVAFTLLKLDGNEEYQEMSSIEVESDGSYTLFLEPGKYSITATKEGYISRSYPFEIEAGQIKIIKLNLEKEGSENYGKNSLYIPIIEGILNSEDYSEGEGFLYDTDEDGLDEMMLLYSVSDGTTAPKVLCSVCDIENGEVFYHIDELQVTTLAGAPEYCVGVVEIVDGTAFMIYTLTPDYTESGTTEEYTIYDGTDYEQTDVLWRDYHDGQYFYSRHGESLSELDFKVLIDGIEFRDLMGSSYSLNVDDYRFSAMSLEELLEYLRGMDITSKTEETSGPDWKQLYYNFIVQDREKADQGDWSVVQYELLYLDEDNIPELRIDYGFESSGCRLVSVSNGAVTSELLSSGSLSYVEHENIFRYSDGKQGMYGDTIYSLNDGKLITLAKGNYNIYNMEYMWEGQAVSETEYQEEIDSFVNPSEAMTTPYSEENPTSIFTYTYDGILGYLGNSEIDREELGSEPITEEVALILAMQYWNIYEGDVDEDTGFPYTFWVLETPEGDPSADDRSYKIALRWYNGSNVSTIDIVVVDALSGECKSFW